jgi:hypothetical protein
MSSPPEHQRELCFLRKENDQLRNDLFELSNAQCEACSLLEAEVKMLQRKLTDAECKLAFHSREAKDSAYYRQELILLKDSLRSRESRAEEINDDEYGYQASQLPPSYPCSSPAKHA